MTKKQSLAKMEGKHHDAKPRYSRKGRDRFYPEAELGEPVRPYSSTFSAVTVIKKMFGLDRPKQP